VELLLGRLKIFGWRLCLTVSRFHHPLNRTKFAQFVASPQVTGTNPVTLHTVVESDIEMEEAAAVSPVDITLHVDSDIEMPEALALPHRRSGRSSTVVEDELDEDEFVVESIYDIDTTQVRGLNRPTIDILILIYRKNPSGMFDGRDTGLSTTLGRI
jgi:hypothetical protein